MKTIKNWKNSCFLLAVVLLSSCAPTYLPNTLNMPLLGEKNDLQVAAYTGISGYDAQVSYAITNHIGAMVNGSFVDWTSDSTRSFRKHTFVEGGVGYYGKLGKFFRAEAYTGYGFGHINALYENDLWSDKVTVNNSRIFLQPNIGFSSKIFDFGIGTRLTYVSLYKADVSSSQFLIEPAVTAKVGYKYAKAVMQVGFAAPLGERLNFIYQPFIFSIGLQMNISEFYKK